MSEFLNLTGVSFKSNAEYENMNCMEESI